MQAFGSSQGITRREDQRFLTGTGAYLADTIPENALHAAFVRAPVAHGTIRAIESDAAREMPGVVAVLTADDLKAAGITAPMLAQPQSNKSPNMSTKSPRPVLAEGVVRYVGEPVAMVIAQSAGQARLAAEEIWVEIDELPVHLALGPGGQTLHESAPDNLAFDWHLGDPAACDAAIASAAHVTHISVRQNRVAAVSMEARAAWAEWSGDRLHFAYGGQGVWVMKRELSRMLNLDPERVQVTTPDVGGGFGMKAMVYNEYFAVAQAARQLGHPVAWVSNRLEAMITDNAARDLTSTATLAFDADNKITAYKVHSYTNLGAYNSQFAQHIQSTMFSKVLTGVYDLPNAYYNSQGIYTNTTPVDAYRGAGRPEAITLLERGMDLAARELGVSPFELRSRNFIRPEQFPYKTPGGETYDVGSFQRVLSRAADLGDVAGFEARKAEARARGKLRGLGLAYYIEAIMGDPSESAAIEFTDQGRVNLYVGTQSNGQGHETVYAKYLSDLTGVPFEAIEVVQGDSDRIAVGGGTGGSRSVTVQASATHATSETMVDAFCTFLETEIDAAPFAFDDGIFSAPGSNQRLTLLEAAQLARARGRDDLLRHEGRTTLDGRSYPNGAHLCEVEIDPETGQLSLESYLAVDDLGVLMHSVLAEGQVHGGVVQGFGQAVTEETVYDSEGQILTGSFMDYAMPRAADLPPIDFVSEPTPSPNNPIGMKGCGEAGTVGALAAISNAALDALWARGVRQVDMPMTPHRIWTWLNEANA